MKKHNDEMTLKDLFGLFVPKIWLIAIFSVIGAIIVGLGSEFLVKDTYTSKVTMYSYMNAGSTDISDISVAEQQVKIYGQLFKSKKFLVAVFEKLDEESKQRYNALDTKPTISVKQKDANSVFDVSVTSTDNKLAYAMAEAIKAVCEDNIIKDVFVPNASVVQVFEDPVLPQVPNSKNVVRNSIIGFAAGAVLSMIAIFIYSLFDVTVRDRKKLEDNFEAPILGVIPRHDVITSKYSTSSRRSRLNRVIAHDSDANDKSRLISDRTPFAISEAFRTLYTNVLYLPIQDRCKKIAVTSGFSGEGKTYISINLALTIARSDSEHRVLLIDSDMRKPRVSHLLKEIKPNVHGLSEYLAGIDSVPNIQQTNLPNLSVLTSGSESANATALISSSRFDSMIEALEGKYDYIIFDTPPANVVSDAILLNDHINGYFIVVRADYSDINEISELFENLSSINANVFGMCLTAVSPKGYNGKYSRYKKYYKYGRYAKYVSYTNYGR